MEDTLNIKEKIHNLHFNKKIFLISGYDSYSAQPYIE